MQVKAFTDGSSPLTQLSGGESLELPLASLGCAAQCKCVLSNLSISMRAQTHSKKVVTQQREFD